MAGKSDPYHRAGNAIRTPIGSPVDHSAPDASARDDARTEVKIHNGDLDAATKARLIQEITSGRVHIDPEISSRFRSVEYRSNGYSTPEKHGLTLRTAPQSSTDEPAHSDSVSHDLEDLHSEYQGVGTLLIDWTLPVEAGRMSEFYAGILRLPPLKMPLTGFLEQVAQAPGLQALVIATWREDLAPRNLSIYAFYDRTNVYENPQGQSGAHIVVSDAYGGFLEALDNIEEAYEDWDLHTDLTHFNTKGKTLAQVLPSIPGKLSAAEFFGVKTTSGSILILSIAQITVGAMLT